MVNIAGLDRATVIQALYAGSRPLGMGHLHYTEGELPREEAESLIGQWIDYLRGRVMKVRIEAGIDEFNEFLYDRDNGSGAAEEAIAPLRTAETAKVG